jgi:hypothetical protein
MLQTHLYADHPPPKLAEVGLNALIVFIIIGKGTVILKSARLRGPRTEERSLRKGVWDHPAGPETTWGSVRHRVLPHQFVSCRGTRAHLEKLALR